MKNKPILTFLMCLSLMAGVLFMGDGGFTSAPAQAASPREPVTIITVDSTDDPDTVRTRTCEDHTPCTLRRAIAQTRNLTAEERPVLIEFDIPTTDPGYDDNLKVWVFDNFQLSTESPSTIFRPLEGGQIIIDGNTQEGGRADGPKIILVGRPGGLNSGLLLTNGNGNVVRGIAFQNFRDSITINSEDNIIEENWFGLNSEGTMPEWRNPNDKKQGSGYNGVVLNSTAENNIIQDNVFLGLIGTAAAIRGNNSTFANNLVGTTAAGTTPGKTTDPNLLCTEWDWYGGSGITLDGNDHVIEGNTFAGIRLDLSPTAEPIEAIRVGGTVNRALIQNNKIGVDSGGQDVGVCGRGINISNSKQLNVQGNELADTFRSAIFLNGALYRDNTLSQNIIRKSTPWLWPEGQEKGDDAILRYVGLPEPFLEFNPARVTSIEDKLVTGTAGEDSPCRNCKIELFLDKDDGISQAMVYLGSTTADADGNWSFTLANSLNDGEGIRTTSTTMGPNIIPGMGPGTTVGLSDLYIPGRLGGLNIFLPLFVK